MTAGKYNTRPGGGPRAQWDPKTGIVGFIRQALGITRPSSAPKTSKRPKPNPRRETSYTVAPGDTRSAMQAYNEDSKSYYESRSNDNIDLDIDKAFNAEARSNTPDEIKVPEAQGAAPQSNMKIKKPRQRSGGGLGAMRRGGVGIAGIKRSNPKKLGGI